MRHILTSIALVILLLPSVALGEVVTIDDLVKRDGLHYKKFTNVPFTGKTTGKEQGSFRNGKKDGPWIYYHDNGQLRLKETLKNGKKDGPWIYYHDNGQLNKEVTLKNGVKDGPWVSYHRNGQVESQGTYKDGKEDGLWIFYYDNGQLKSKRTYKNSKREGYENSYHRNGQVESQGAYKDGKKEGLWILYYDNGLVSSKGTYKDGLEVSDSAKSLYRPSLSSPYLDPPKPLLLPDSYTPPSSLTSDALSELKKLLQENQ